MDNVCNHSLFSFPAKVEMAEEQEYLWALTLQIVHQSFSNSLLL